jgi:hypothetical protein
VVSVASATSVGSLAKASQTEPLGRRYSAGAEAAEGEEEGSEEVEEAGEAEPGKEEEPGEAGARDPRRRSSSAAAYGSGGALGAATPAFQCNLCQISLNSQSQVAQVRRHSTLLLFLLYLESL